MFSVLAIKILFFFFPGIIATKIMEFLSDGKKKLPTNEFIINSFVFGMTSYLIIYCFKGDDSFIGSLSNETPSSDILEIMYATGIGASLSVIILILKEKGILHRVARKAKVTNDLSHESVLKSIYNSTDSDFKKLQGSWVNVRYADSPKFFFGYIHSYGETSNGEIELLLQSVDIFQNRRDNKPVNQSGLYLRTDPSKIYIEYFSGLEPK